MNERMTKRDTDGQAMMDCEKCKADWTGKHGKPMADCTALYCRNRLLDRLVAHEEIAELCGGFDRLRELAEADKDGRVVVLPCKVGDTVYRVFTVDGREPVIQATQVKTFGQAADLIGRIGKLSKLVSVFRTREEAERAIQEVEGAT